MTGRELLRMQGALHGLRGAGARERARGAARARRADAGRATGGSAATPAACGAGSTWRSRSCTARASCSSTSRRPAWTRRAARALWREVRALNDDGTTVFLTTQYLEEAEQLADRVGIIAAGKLVAEGTPDELKARVGEPTLHVELADPGARRGRARRSPRSASVEPPRPGRAAQGRAAHAPRARRAIAPVIRALDEPGVEVESVEVETPTLDDVFAAVTGSHLEGAGSSRRREARGVAASCARSAARAHACSSAARSC